MMKASPHDIMTEEEIKKLFPDKDLRDVAEPIPDNEVETCRKMNRKERRAWLAKQRKSNGPS